LVALRSSKLQAPKKLQVSNPNGLSTQSELSAIAEALPASMASRFGAWVLELLWDLELGIWSLFPYPGYPLETAKNRLTHPKRWCPKHVLP
jgi:hypothetical protein